MQSVAGQMIKKQSTRSLVDIVLKAVSLWSRSFLGHEKLERDFDAALHPFKVLELDNWV